MSNYNGYAIIYGSNGAVGTACTKIFKANNWWIGCIDFWKPSQEEENSSEELTRSTHSIIDPSDKKYKRENINRADLNILVDSNKKASEQETEISEIVSAALGSTKLDAVICLAGDFVMGNANEQLSSQTDLMWKKNVWPALVSTSITVKFMKEGGFLCLPGAKAALQGSPSSVAYGIAKAAIHQLIKSLATEGSALPRDSLCVGLLPVTIDTVMNASDTMPDIDIAEWTPTKHISKMLFNWSIGVERPDSGTFVLCNRKNFNTDISFIKDVDNNVID